jgi:excisionase family DNA binding protein
MPLSGAPSILGARVQWLWQLSCWWQTERPCDRSGVADAASPSGNEPTECQPCSEPRGNTRSPLDVVFFVFLAQDEGMDVTDLIATGEAARLLRCSRQHVVDLCDEGKLPVVRKGGSHRYVRRSDVLALLGPSLTRDQEQSRWLHGAIVGHLVTEPDLVLGRAHENLDRFSKVHAGTMAEHWLDLWRRTLNSGLDQVLTVLVSDTPEAAELRQNSPFAGILSEEERRRVLDSFREHWRSEHAHDT